MYQSKRTRLIGLCAILIAMTEPVAASPPHAVYGGDPSCPNGVCPVRKPYNYYPTKWQRWPGAAQAERQAQDELEKRGIVKHKPEVVAPETRQPDTGPPTDFEPPGMEEEPSSKDKETTPAPPDSFKALPIPELSPPEDDKGNPFQDDDAKEPKTTQVQPIRGLGAKPSLIGESSRRSAAQDNRTPLDNRSAKQAAEVVQKTVAKETSLSKSRPEIIQAPQLASPRVEVTRRATKTAAPRRSALSSYFDLDAEESDVLAANQEPQPMPATSRRVTPVQKTTPVQEAPPVQQVTPIQQVTYVESDAAPAKPVTKNQNPLRAGCGVSQDSRQETLDARPGEGTTAPANPLRWQ